MAKLDALAVTQDYLEGYRIYRAQDKLKWFIDFCYPDYDCQWFHEYICTTLDRLIRGDFKKVAIFVPPQCGKSFHVSVHFPAFLLGNYPDTQMALCSYAHDLASKFNRAVQRIMDDNPYKELFQSRLKPPGSKGSTIRTTTEFQLLGHYGGLKSVGVSGPLTGNRVDVGIIDDVVKDSEQAYSPVYRNRAWEWYHDVFCRRLHNNSRQVMCLTRWHEDDLAGRILRSDSEWKVIRLPGIKEEEDCIYDRRSVGQALWESRHSAESYRKIEKIHPRTYSSLIQQRPSPAEGSIFKSRWFKYYSVVPTFEKVIQSWDLAFKDASDSDFVVGTIWGQSGVNLYLIGMFRGKWDFVKTLSMMKKARERYPDTATTLIEDKANGAAIISVLKSKIPGIIAVNPKESKEARAYASTDYFEAGNILFPTREIAPWISSVEDELKFFPVGQYDDIVDSVTQCIRHTYQTNTGWASKIAL